VDIFFQDPTEVPLPPEDVRIRELKPSLWPDGRRVRIYFEIDPFQQRPNIHAVILNQHGDELAEVSIIETLTRKMEFNMHLRQVQPDDQFTVKVVLYYQPVRSEAEASAETLSPDDERQVVDTAEAAFSVA